MLINIQKQKDSSLPQVFFIILFFQYLQLFAQIEITRNISVEDGLAYSQVTCALEDSRGILWFGTSSGLSEWNSFQFKNYYNSDGLPSQYIKSIIEDRNNNIIVGTANGVAFFNGKKFYIPTNLPEELNDAINKIYKRRDDSIIFLTENNGVWEKHNNKYIRLHCSDKSSKFISIVETEKEKLILGTRNSGRYTTLNDSLIKMPHREVFVKYPIKDIYQDKNGTIVYALQNLGLVFENNGNYRYLFKRHGLSSDYVNDISEGPNNQLYVATRDGISIIENYKVKKILDKSSGLDNEFFISTYKTSDGAFLFLSEGGGVYLYKPGSFITYNEKSGLINNTVWVIHQNKDSSYYFATDEGISHLKNNEFKSITTKDGLGDNLVISIHESKNGNIYWGTHNKGVTIFKKDGSKRIISKRNGLINNSIWYILEDDDGLIYFISHKGGITLFDGESIVDTLNHKDGLPVNSIISAFKKKDGTILISVDAKGIYILKDGKFFLLHDDMANCQIWSMFEANNGDFYFGTNEHGLIRCYGNSQRDTIGVKQGLSNNSVIGIEEDSKGNIYAITDNGLNIVKRKGEKEYFVRQILKQSGLANNECNQGAIFKDLEGSIWVGTIGGVTKIDPSIELGNLQKIKVIFSSLSIFDNEIDLLHSNLKFPLAYDENYLKFEFVGINYFEPNLVKYRYRLKNIDTHWIQSSRNFVQYTNLPSGKYVFEVVASNQWGVWSKPATFVFSISSPFWKTWWFFLFVIAIIVMASYLIIQYRLKQIQLVYKLRTKISADLHDDIGSGLSEITILSELLKYNENISDKQKTGLAQITKTSNEIIEKLSDIVWLVNPKKDSSRDLILRLVDSYQEVLSRSDIILNFSNMDNISEFRLSLFVRQNLYLLVKEAINNSIKYSNCSIIDVKIESQHKILTLNISDDGDGFDITKIKRGNGLFNMEDRAKAIEAKFSVISTVGSGTQIIVVVKLGKLKIIGVKDD